MTLEKQVCSLELAKRLKEFGVKQESLFWWSLKWNGFVGGFESEDKGREVVDFKDGSHAEADPISAFTVAELGEILPDEICVEGSLYQLEASKTGPGSSFKTWLVSYADIKDALRSEQKNIFWAREDTEADARAKMLIYLIEQKLITV